MKKGGISGKEEKNPTCAVEMTLKASSLSNRSVRRTCGSSFAPPGYLEVTALRSYCSSTAQHGKIRKIGWLIRNMVNQPFAFSL